MAMGVGDSGRQVEEMMRLILETAEDHEPPEHRIIRELSAEFSRLQSDKEQKTPDFTFTSGMIDAYMG